ncbi:MAG: glycosyltransferase domain-containing protein, partial [Chthoniobacterales bacterium]
MPRVCVYTAICGGYDTLKPIPEQDVACDYLCFSDDAGLTSPGPWKIMPVSSSKRAHPRMRARFFKTLHHRLFKRGRLSSAGILAPRYDYTVWIDGSIQVKSASFVREFLQHIGASGWSMFVHPDRNCIYPEAEFSMTMPKYFDQPI